MFFRIKNVTIGLFRWFGFNIKHYGNVLYISIGFIAIDIYERSFI
jgi:hypothetical protein